ncbi:MAG: selenide, water dikinase SelD [Cyclobacteriaceae bacterium]|nr:selenide, water dikinase SelD [Cyclobacteriaceae bacterium]
MKEIKLTQYSHGAGCGCKISPKVLDEIIGNLPVDFEDANLLVGNTTKDDAAVYALDEHTAIISTTDFFMPIVDDPYDFGAIAATNAISDIYAMGGAPIMAISILGWPIDKLPASVARAVVAGARQVCAKAGIMLAGGHSIDAPEPIFGLAVTGKVHRAHIKTNDKARIGSRLFLTKPLGIGILTTAQKKGLLKAEDLHTAKNLMLQLNQIGAELGKIEGITALTDVTGFGLLGHLVEICEGSGVSASIIFNDIPTIGAVPYYLEHRCVPGGTNRNFDSYGHKVSEMTLGQKHILCDPQTSGGLLVAVDPDAVDEVQKLFESRGLELTSFGEINQAAGKVLVNVV